MTQDERWQKQYQDVMDFMDKNHRNPSRHRIEDHDMLNWLKANRKTLNAGKLKEDRVEKFRGGKRLESCLKRRMELLRLGLLMNQLRLFQSSILMI